MKTKKNKKGFTLAELLIVVAIIAVLVAIAIPVFTTQLEKSAEGADIANIRSAYAEAMASAVAGDTEDTAPTGVTVGTSDAGKTYAVDTPPAQSTGDFDKADISALNWLDDDGLPSATKGSAFTVTVTIDDEGNASTHVS